MTDSYGLEHDTAAHDAQAGLGASTVGPAGILAAITEILVTVLLLVAGVVGAWALSQTPSPVTGPARGAGHTVAQTQAAVDPVPEPAAASVGGPVLRPSAGPGGGVVRWGDDHVTIQGGRVRSILATAFGVNPSQVQFQVEEPTTLFDVHLTGDNWSDVLREALKREMGVMATHERRCLPAYALRVTGALPQRLGPGLKQRVYGNSYVWRGFAIDRMIFPVANSDKLAMLIQGRLGHRVVDQTGLMGTYEVDMKLPEAFHLSFDALDAFVQSGQAVPDTDVAVFAGAVRRELGLELVELEGGHRFEVLVVGKTAVSGVDGANEGGAAAAPSGVGFDA